MSWRDNVESIIFTIRTGDGQLYTPDLPINYETSKEFETATFKFINLPGGLIARKQPGPRKFPLVFFFQGEDNIDQANAFDISANDPRAWTVRHPQYGDITGQPISIARDDTKLNATQITVDFWESITTSQPVAIIAPAAAITITVGILNTVSPVDYSAVVNLSAADQSIITDNVNSINALINKNLPAANYTDYQQLAGTMLMSVDNVLQDSEDAIASINNSIIETASFDASISARITLLSAIYEAISSTLNINDTANTKSFFEAVAGITIAALSNAILLPGIGNYVTRLQVNTAGAALAAMYANYLSVINAAYIQIGNPGNSYSAAFNTQNTLQNVVLQALGSLMTLAFNAKIERTIITDKPEQLIVLVHKYMSLDPDDANIETFRTINDLKNNYLFLIPAGTLIKYYV